MEYKKFGSKYLIRLDKGDEIVESIKEISKKEKIRLATVSGIGAVNKATIGLFETSTLTYHNTNLSGDMEIVSLSGNISEMDGDVYIHLHIALGDASFNVKAGHLNLAIISVTGEIIIDVIDGVVDREFNKEIGLNLFKLN